MEVLQRFRSNHTGGHGKCFLKFSDCGDYPHRGGKRKAFKEKRAHGAAVPSAHQSLWPPRAEVRQRTMVLRTLICGQVMISNTAVGIAVLPCERYRPPQRVAAS